MRLSSNTGCLQQSFNSSLSHPRHTHTDSHMAGVTSHSYHLTLSCLYDERTEGTFSFLSNEMHTSASASRNDHFSFIKKPRCAGADFGTPTQIYTFNFVPVCGSKSPWVWPVRSGKNPTRRKDPGSEYGQSDNAQIGRSL